MFKPTLYQGRIGQWNVNELAQTGVLTTSVKFSSDEDVRETKAHLGPAQLDQIVQVRTINRGLIIDLESEIIPDANGNASGLGRAWAGSNIAVCAHFAAEVRGEADEVLVPAQNRLGYTRDPAKLLQVRQPNLELSPETSAALKLQAKYLPFVEHDAEALMAA